MSYQNIGPLYEQALSIFFREGKYLINAPIGTGKSFLFFDGPLYALYKYSERKLLNNRSNTGYIKILFSQGEQWYFLTRTLTPGKTKDSCSSALYFVKNPDPTLFQEYETIVKDSDIETILQQQGVQLEAIPYKNEADLNMGVSELLPPREVFVNTMFLLQDSGNIFELTPANRLLVLKNIFGLLGVDEIKDKMAQIKRDIQTQKKIFSSTEEADKKLKELLQHLLQHLAKAEHAISLTPYQEAIQDIKLVAEQVNIEKFRLDPDFFSLHTAWEQHIQKNATHYTTLTTQKDSIQKEGEQLRKTITQHDEQLTALQQQKHDLSKKIEQLNGTKLEQLKQEKTELQKQIQAFDTFPDKEALQNFVSTTPELFSTFQWKRDFSDFPRVIQILLDQGKLLKLEQENIQTRITRKQKEVQDLELALSEYDINKEGSKYQIRYQQQLATQTHQLENQIQEHKNQIQTLQKEYEHLQEQTTDIQKKIKQYKSILEKKLPFYQKYLAQQDFDTEIQKSTYVDIQNEHSHLQQQYQAIQENLGLEALQQQIATHQEQDIALKKQLQALQEDPQKYLQEFFQQLDTEKQNITQQLASLKQSQEIEERNQQLQTTTTRLSSIKNFLSTIARKDILDRNEAYTTLQNQRKHLDEQITHYEEQAKKIQEYTLQHTTLETQITALQQQKSNTEKKLEESKQQYLHYSEQLKGLDIETIQQEQAAIRDMDKTLHSITSLIDDFAALVIKVKKLQHEESLAKNLYTALSKDLILFVLEDNLPILSDLINTFLSPIVPFHIDMRLEQKGSSLELHTMIVDDEKGSRETRSLSGGQKVILKLVRMLAVSVYSQSKMLFLDETINNLDPEAVIKVAELLKNFVQQNKLKMYIVTHSTEIKAMNIWDGAIELEKML